MTVAIAQFAQPFSFSWLEQMNLVNGAVGRLLVACLLGGVIGLEREFSRKDAGLRTNLLICLGSAFFTLLSPVIAGETGANRAQIASNIVQGIGFLGAGLILHNRSRVSGLTSAASVWVVASIGMACGAGLYAPAVVATVIVVVSLLLIGFFEHRANLKIYPMIYEARGRDQTLMLQTILNAMDKVGPAPHRLRERRDRRVAARYFLAHCNQESPRTHPYQSDRPTAIDALLTFRDPEED